MKSLDGRSVKTALVLEGELLEATNILPSIESSSPSLLMTISSGACPTQFCQIATG